MEFVHSHCLMSYNSADGRFYFKSDMKSLCKLQNLMETASPKNLPFNHLFVVAVQLSPPPQYIDERLTLYAKLKAEHEALMAERAAKDSRPIKVTLPDGKVVEAESWKTTPYQVACGIRSV